MESNDSIAIWEEPAASDSYRQTYIAGIENCLERLNAEAAPQRRKFMNAQTQADGRRYLSQMLGIHLFEKPTSLSPQLKFAGESDLGIIYRLTVYIAEEIPFYALFILPKNTQAPMPLVIAQHGGGGTPELCSDLHGKNNYNHMVRRCLERGAAVIAPQLLLWSTVERDTQRCHPVAFNREKVDALLKRFGSSITGLEICGIQRCLDFACSRDDIDSQRIGMIGLSYGGYFSLHTMARDERIKAGYSAGAFNSRDKHCLCDWSYHAAAYHLQDAEVAALCAPRKLYLQVGIEDSVFDYRSAIEEAEQAKNYFRQFGCEDSLRFDVWPGGHTISDHDQGFDFLFDALK